MFADTPQLLSQTGCVDLGHSRTKRSVALKLVQENDAHKAPNEV